MNGRRMTWKMSAALAALVMASAAAGSAEAAAVRLIPQVQVRGLFGESDEEKAARLKAEQRENDQDAGIAELRQRLSDLEQALRNATGTNEQLSHQIRQLNDRIEKQQRDYDTKLCELSAQILGAGAPGQGGFACDQSSGAGQASSNQIPPGQGTSTQVPAPQMSGGGGSLGTLPAGAPPADATRGQYDDAMNLLARARYDEARAAFRGFADANPKDPLTPQAVYWVGNIAYVQKDYPTAAQAFAEQIKKYPSSPQGGESMLKLGLSLIAMGEKKEGCLTLGAIKTKYKQAPPNILTQASAAREKSCSK